MKKIFFHGLCLWGMVSVFSCGGIGKKGSDADFFPIDSLLREFRAKSGSDPQNCRKEIRALLPEVPDSTSYYRLETVIATTYFYEGKTDSAISTDLEVLSFCSRTDDTSFRRGDLEATAANDLGAYTTMSGDYAASTRYLRHAEEVLIRYGMKESLPSVYINLADAYDHNGEYAEATSTYRKALRAAEDIDEFDRYRFSIYSGLGRIYTHLENFAMADYCYSLVEEELATLSSFEQYFYSIARGNYYYAMKDYPKAKDWMLKGYEISRSLGQPYNNAIAEGNLGELYLAMGQTDSAGYYLEKAAAVFLTPGSNASSAFYIHGLYALLYLQKGRLEEAEKHLSVPFDKTQLNPSYLYYNHRRLAELYEKKGNYREAFFHLSQADNLGDSLMNTRVQNNVAEIESRYRQDTTLLRKDVIIARQEEEVSRLHLIVMLISAVLLTGALAALALYAVYRKRKEARYVRQMATVTALRMENVRNRISPHFIFNALNVIIPSIRQHEELVQPVEQLISAIRGNLLLSEKPAVELKEEIEVVENYLALLESLHSPLPEIEWYLDPAIDRSTLIPSMIVQIPVENAIKYAFEGLPPGASRLSLCFEKQGAALSVTVEDNGRGYDPSRYADGKRGTGSGLKILYRTIELFNTQNHDKIRFRIENRSGEDETGTRVTVLIPPDYKYSL